MATIELAQLSAHLDEAQVEALTAAVSNETNDDLDFRSSEEGHIIDGNIDDDIFVDFRDRLDANDLDADLYLPVEFEEVVTIGDIRVGSSYALQLVLDSLREDFFVEDEADSELVVDDVDDDFEREIDETDEAESYYEDEDGGIEMKDEQLRHVWRVMYQAALESLSSNLSLFLRG